MAHNKKDIAVILLLALFAIAAIGGILYGRHCSSTPPDEPLPHAPADSTHIPALPLPEQDSTASHHHNFHAGQLYLVYCNHDSAFVSIQEVQGTYLQGQVFPLTGEEYTSPIPFRYQFHTLRNALTIGDSTLHFPRHRTELGTLPDGHTHLLTDCNGHRYQVRFLLQTPPHPTPTADARYLQPLYRVRTLPNIVYATANGYWTERDWDNSQNYTKTLFEGIRKSLAYSSLPLEMDLYLPATPREESTPVPPADSYRHPLILFIHGGAFYVGNKRDKAITAWCHHFASLGYVCASIDYRMGFIPTRESIERAGYMATQDAHAAMRYLVHHAELYNIDTQYLFAAGCSAGAITALNLAFMTEQDRPTSTYGNRNNKDTKTKKTPTDKPTRLRLNREADLGHLHTSGNTLTETFHIRAVANMWGAVNNPDMLHHSTTDIISFHGNADRIVPYDRGYPFQDANNKMGELMIGTLYGSAAITREARKAGCRAQLHTLYGMDHAPQLNEDRTLNKKVFNLIRDSITPFFYATLVPQPAHIEVEDSHPGHYRLQGTPATDIQWSVEGGFLLHSSNHEAQVVWNSQAPVHTLHACGRYPSGIHFCTQWQPPAPTMLALNKH